MYNPRMVTAGSARKLTYDDLLAMPDDGLRHEIIDGVLYVSPSPSRPHQFTLGKLHQAIANFLDAHPLGEVYLAPFDVVFTRHDVVEPDLLFVTAARLAVLTDRNVSGSPDLAVEVLSPSTRRVDLELKRDLFERESVAEYWVIDPIAGTIVVHRKEGARFTQGSGLSLENGDRLRSSLLPGFEVSLERLFRSTK
ncbi:MAG: Uma2 family endonuclease [Vicinamibacterales bacterium]